MPPIPRIPPRSRQGPVTKQTTVRSQRVLGRKYIGGVGEQETVKALAQWRIQNDAKGVREPGDQDRANQLIVEEETEDDELDGFVDSEFDDYVTRKRYSYSREYKLAAVAYWETTYCQLKDGTDERITIRYAARNRTVTLRTARSGWDKRQVTLQVIVFVDGVNRCKPLLMFKGKPGKGNKNRRLEMARYHPAVKVIWNDTVYANSENLINWIRQDYSHASEYPLSDQEPRLLVLDAFAPHKHSGKKVSTNESAKAKAKRLEAERLNQQIRDEFLKLNVTLSLIPGGCTGYVQVLDVAINSLLKAIIKELEEVHIDQNLEKWNNNEYFIQDRRILLTNWVGEAWLRIHSEHKQTIVKTFRNLSLSLNPDSSEDSELKIRDLLDISVGDYTSSSTNPTPIDDDDELEGDTIVVEGTYISVEEKEVLRQEREDDIMTDTGNDIESAFDSDSELDSSEEESGDENQDMADVTEE
ncbi:hypothetical protein ACEPPN_006681 [Leptodophora sp. 'Broadleaf-Isolate-01']